MRCECALSPAETHHWHLQLPAASADNGQTARRRNAVSKVYFGFQLLRLIGHLSFLAPYAVFTCRAYATTNSMTSVRLSVTLVDYDHIGLWSYRLVQEKLEIDT